MQLHQLAYALAVAEEQSFTRAADRLHLAQPSLSRQVRLLENELGVVLFNRGPGQGPVTLTADGETLLPVHAARAVRRRGHRRGGPGAVGHGARPPRRRGHARASSPARSPPRSCEFHRSHPGIDLSVVEAGSHQLLPQVATGEVDLALIVLPVDEPLVVTTPLFDDPLVLATARDHPLADRTQVSVRDLDRLDLVMFREGYDLRAVTLDACRAAGVEPHLVSEGGEMAGVLSFVAAGLGAAVVPEIALPDDGSLAGIPFVGARRSAAPSPWPSGAIAPSPARRRPPSSCWTSSPARAGTARAVRPRVAERPRTCRLGRPPERRTGRRRCTPPLTARTPRHAQASGLGFVHGWSFFL